MKRGKREGDERETTTVSNVSNNNNNDNNKFQTTAVSNVLPLEEGNSNYDNNNTNNNNNNNNKFQPTAVSNVQNLGCRAVEAPDQRPLCEADVGVVQA